MKFHCHLKTCVFVLLFGLLLQNAISQNAELYTGFQKIEAKYLNYMQYTDTEFPVLDANGANLATYKIALEEYAKLHPPVPVAVSTGDAAADKVNNQILLDNWYSANPYFPRYIPYHLYHKNLSETDDIRFYEDAVITWKERNQTLLKREDK